MIFNRTFVVCSRRLRVSSAEDVITLNVGFLYELFYWFFIFVPGSDLEEHPLLDFLIDFSFSTNTQKKQISTDCGCEHP